MVAFRGEKIVADPVTDLEDDEILKPRIIAILADSERNLAEGKKAVEQHYDKLII